MPDTYTLAVGGVEKTLQAWGVLLDAFELEFNSLSPSVARLTTTERFDPAASQWSFKQHASIKRNGEVIFQGYFTDAKMSARPNAQNIVYELRSVWWLFERNQFKQYTNQFAGFSPTNKRVIAATVAAGGRNYAVNDTGTILGGAGTSATYLVAAVDAANGNAARLVVLTNGGGNYTGAPQTPAATQATSGVGGGLTLALTLSPAPILTPKVVSEVFLGEDLHQADGYTSLWPNGNGDQIGEVLDWMNLSYNPTRHPSFIGPPDPNQDVVRRGTIDPHTKMPITRVNTYFAAEAIRDCLRWDPDTICDEDPTTSPPTLHFRKLAHWDYGTVPPTFKNYLNLPAVGIQITASQERRLLVQGQQSKVLPGVIIIYKVISEVTTNVNGAASTVQAESFVYDIFPADGSVDVWTPETSTHLIELEGSKLTKLVAQVVVNQPVPLSFLASGDAQLQAQWWINQDKSLTDPAVDQSTVAVAGPLTVVAEGTNVPVDIANTYVNQLNSPLPNWTGATSIRVRVSQPLSFTRKAGAVSETKQGGGAPRVHNKTIVVTNAVGQLYTTTGSFTQAEPIPQNVAESVYRSLAMKQYTGTIELDDYPLRGTVALGNRLVLQGPNHTFGDPNDKVNPSVILVQSITQRPARGQTDITYGPTPVVNLATWIELARATRGRLTWNLPSGRGDGGTNPSGSQVSVDTGAVAPADDTSHGVGGLSLFSVTGAAL